MRGLWRPFLALGGLVALIHAFLFYPSQGADPVLLGIFGLLVVLYASFFVGVSWLLAHRFLAGVREAGATVEVREDAFGWFGARTVRFAAAGGSWTITSEMHRYGVDFEVTPPGRDHPVELSGNKRELGRTMATRVAQGLPALEPPEPEDPGAPSGTARWFARMGKHHPVALGALLTSVPLGLHLVGGWGLSRASPQLPEVLFWAALWAGLWGMGFIGMFWGMLALRGVHGDHPSVAEESYDSGGLAAGFVCATGGVVGSGAFAWLAGAMLWGRVVPTPTSAALGLAAFAVGLGLLAVGRQRAVRVFFVASGSVASVLGALLLPVPQAWGAVAGLMGLIGVGLAWKRVEGEGSATLDGAGEEQAAR